MSDCCRKCENLPIHTTKSKLVKEKRLTNKRWNEKYSAEEISNIKTVIMKNYDPREKVIKKGKMLLPESMHECLKLLREKSGRPVYGFLGKLVSERILLIEFGYRNIPRSYYLNTERIINGRL